MSLCKLKFWITCCLFLVVFTSSVFAQEGEWTMVHGDVVRIFPEQFKIMLEKDGQKSILELAQDCQILRQGRPCTIESLRPVFPGAYQDALCWFNERGLVSVLLVNYSVQEENGTLVARDIFGNVKYDQSKGISF